MAEEQTPEDEITPEAAPEAEAAGETQPVAEPAEALSPKERRRRERAAKAAAVPARPQTSPEERQAERQAERRRKAEIRRGTRRRAREKARSQRGETPEPLAPRREQHPGQQKTRQGVVVSDRASKTIVVRIDVTRRHRSYGKVVRTSTTLHAHDEREDAHIGDTVVVRESRPLSRTKRWRLVEVVERAQ
jgi:small subunit ribosomal protein S17